MEERELKTRLAELASPKDNLVDESVSSVAKAALARLNELEQDQSAKTEPLLIVGWGVAGLVFLVGYLLNRFLNLADPSIFYSSLFIVAFIAGIYAMFKPCTSDRG